MKLLESIIIDNGKITIIPSGTIISIVESRTIGDYDIETSTDEKRIFVPDPKRPGKKIPINLLTQTALMTHKNTGETVTFGGYKHQGKWLYSFINRHGDKKTGYSLREITEIMSRMIPVDISSVEKLLSPRGSESDIRKIQPTSQEDSLRAVKTLMDMVDELQAAISNETDQNEIAELNSELQNAKTKLAKLGVVL